MGLVIATRGVESEKLVHGRCIKTVPFVGADREGEFAHMGCGLIFPDQQEGTIWGTAFPHALFQSWRGMKILERINCIDFSTLCACWTAAGNYVHNSAKYLLDTLAEQLGDQYDLQALRNEVLASVPSADELNTMITNFREKGVDVDSWELEEAVRAGRIATSPLIEKLACEEKERRQVPTNASEVEVY